MSALRFLMPNVSSITRRSLVNRSTIAARTNVVHQFHASGSRLAQRTTRRFNSSQSTARTATPKSSSSLTGRIKELSRKYGRAAVFVYLGISLIDFGIAFAAVHALGTERIGRYEDALLGTIKAWTGYAGKSTVDQVESASEDMARQMQADGRQQQKEGRQGQQQQQQQQQGEGRQGKASLWTEVVIAYGIHKAIFIFARVPITVAITPAIVKSLVRRGYKIGPAATTSASTAAAAAKKGSK